MGLRPDSSRDRAIVAAVGAWFREHARPLPWRVSPRDPYLSLVSEFMLQQTQVSRVLARWPEFLGRFPTLADLARAPERAVLAAWSGMGYYRRARHLHAAARGVMERFGGRIPGDAAALRTLPGVGPYTAGAIASIVFGRPEPIVDGNVARVLLRLEGKELAAPDGARWAWERAAPLVRAGTPSRPRGSTRSGIGPGVLNEGLMELGAVVCTPRNPRCGECPLRRLCIGRRLGRQHAIPRARARGPRQDLYCAAVVVRDDRGRVLVEPRGTIGLWAGMWQAPTLERPGRRATAREVARWIGAPVVRVERFDHGLSHRRARFEVWSALGWEGVARPGAAFRSPGAVSRLALSSPQRRILLEHPGESRAPANPRVG